MKTTLTFIVAIIVVALISLASAQQEPCTSAPNCQVCVKDPGCGWCSQNVTEKDGQPGAQCQLIAHKGSGWKCPAMFSIEQCARGYECDQVNFQCVANNDGNGKSLADCQQNCTNNGKVYVCNKTNPENPTCEAVPPGTAGSQSLLACHQQCMLHPTNTATNTGAPHSHVPTHPTTTLDNLFACNFSSGMCEPSVPGKGASKEVCEQTCKKESQGYTCLVSSQECVPLPHGVPGPSKSDCEAKCNPTAAPNPPPTFPQGLYRGNQIDNGYNMGTIYVEVQETSFTMVMMKNGAVESYIEGTPTHVGPHPSNENNEIMIVDITAPASLAGKKLGTISDITGLPGPQTTFITMAYNTAFDGSYPDTIEAAMASSSSHVLALSKCQTPFCKYTLPKLPSGMIYEARHRSLFPQHFLDEARLSLRNSNGASVNDSCSQYGSSCNTCIGHVGCGWCGSGDIVYINGQTGTQCASGAPGTTPWVCAKNFRTESCPIGYSCNRTEAKCYQAPAGDSNNTLEQCMEQCVTTATPAPKVALYYCNLTDAKNPQCVACGDQPTCPGSFPKSQCGQCAHHKKGPGPSLKNSNWRGLQINQGYDQNEYQMIFGNTTVTGFKSGKQIFEADVVSFGNDVMVFTYTSGKMKGFKRSMYFQESAEVPKNLYEAITFAEGDINGKVPTAFNTPMQTVGENVYIFWKCNGAPCKFHTP